jgi:aryl-phospho-beta-D-glucosidase BglC (GH1 family)
MGQAANNISTSFACSGAGGCEAPFVGVNLGGWLLLEDWMWAAEMKDKGIEDEWTLTLRNGGPEDPNAIAMMRAHWEGYMTEEDLDRLKEWGVTHVRVPIGWWLVDYDPSDGFVHGGERYLFRLLAWLQQRGMRALLDLHALPGGQAVHQSFTGQKVQIANFFLDPMCYERGKRAMRSLARLIVTYESNVLTSGVVVGMELCNEPLSRYWGTSPGIRELYEIMVPDLRRILPANRYSLVLNFQESPRVEGVRWLARMKQQDPGNYEGVVYDAHVYHSYGDDNGPGRTWTWDVDSCKTCCRDPTLMSPLVEAKIPFLIGEYSLNTGFAGNPAFWHTFMREQLSLWKHLPGALGSFFWNHRVQPGPHSWYQEMSLLDLIRPNGPIVPVKSMHLSALCPGKNLSNCPTFNAQTTKSDAECAWTS